MGYWSQKKKYDMGYSVDYDFSRIYDTWNTSKAQVLHKLALLSEYNLYNYKRAASMAKSNMGLDNN